MPTYEYKCDACGTTFERFQTMSAAPVKKCPKCGKNKVRRLISAGAGLIFKGSGFYITDYRDKSYNDSAKADTSGGDKTSSDTKTEKSDKGETKTETKAESKPAEGSKSEAAPAKAESKPSESASKSFEECIQAEEEEILMRCPTCKKELPDPMPEDDLPKWFPFCSDRCKLIDIGRWADGKYQISTPEESADDEPKSIDGD